MPLLGRLYQLAEAEVGVGVEAEADVEEGVREQFPLFRLVQQLVEVVVEAEVRARGMS